MADEAYHYVWEGERVVLDFVDSDGGDNSLNDGASSASLALAMRYLWGRAVDQLLAQETADDGGKEDVSYIVRDNLGSTRLLVNSSGTITAGRTVRWITRPRQSSPPAVLLPFRSLRSLHSSSTAEAQEI